MAELEAVGATKAEISVAVERTPCAVKLRLTHLRQTNTIATLTSVDIARILGLTRERMVDGVQGRRKHTYMQNLFGNASMKMLMTSHDRLANWCRSREAFGIDIDRVTDHRYRAILLEARSGYHVESPEQWASRLGYDRNSAYYHVKTGKAERVHRIGTHGGGYLLVTPVRPTDA